MAFVRSKTGNNILVTGHRASVQEHISTLGPCLVSFRYYHHGKTRGPVAFCNSKLRISHLAAERKPRQEFLEHDREYTSHRYSLFGLQASKHDRYVVHDEKYKVLAVWRRIPQKFPADLDNS